MAQDFAESRESPLTSGTHRANPTTGGRRCLASAVHLAPASTSVAQTLAVNTAIPAANAASPGAEVDNGSSIARSPLATSTNSADQFNG